MTTLEGLQQRIRQQVMGYVQNQQQVSALAADMTSVDTTFTVEAATVNNISRGLVEVDDELILVKSVDRATNIVSVMGGINGRAQQGTTAAAHVTNKIVTQSPLIPRIRTVEAINDVIRMLSPDLPVLAVTEITNLAPVFEYALPATANGVWYVVDQLVGPTKIWQPAPRWRYNPKSNTTDFPSGKSIQLLDGVTPGRAMRVVYTIEPLPLVNPTDDIAVTGYTERIVDLVVWGACARIIPAYETARLQAQAVEGTERAALTPPKAALQAAAYYQSLFSQRKEEERARIMDETPNYAFWQGG